MDDELEDKVLYQTFVSHMKILSKFAVGIPSLNSTVSYLWKILRLYILRPEFVLCGIVLLIIFVFLQTADVVRSRSLFGRIFVSLGGSKSTKSSKLSLLTSTAAVERDSWEIKKSVSALYAVQGRRPKMEDRFIVDENISNTGISLFAIFDGHGGEFAADFAKDIFIQNLIHKIVETSNVVTGKSTTTSECSTTDDENDKQSERSKVGRTDSRRSGNDDKTADRLNQRKSRKTYSATEDCISKGNCQNTAEENFLILNKLSSIVRPLTKDALFGSGTTNKNNNNNRPQTFSGKCYVENGKINFGKMITDEILAADYKLVEQAKKNANVAGTTALIAIIRDSILTVANVGDSRGVMCNAKGNAIPLSFDHKPQLSRERKRIQEAGGFIAFKGVWRVAGILATSRALGDYPLKENNLVIADPDILTFDLTDHKPMFLILASDGLWDTFSNEEAVAFIKERLDEPTFGAKSITLQSYYRGSVDNISVLVIVFKDGKFKVGSSAVA